MQTLQKLWLRAGMTSPVKQTFGWQTYMALGMCLFFRRVISQTGWRGHEPSRVPGAPGAPGAPEDTNTSTEPFGVV